MRLLSRLWRRLAGRWIGTAITVTGESMSPTFVDGDRAILTSGPSNLRRFDVVVLRPPGTGREDIKRIVGLPDELIEIRDGRLRVDGEVVDEPHLDVGMPEHWLHAWGTNQYEYVVLGDNRSAEGISDSRRYGPVSKSTIVGTVVQPEA